MGTNYSELLKDDRTYQSLSSSLADVAGDLSFDLDVGQILMSMYVESKSRSDSEKLAFGKIWREFAAITEAEAGI